MQYFLYMSNECPPSLLPVHTVRERELAMSETARRVGGSVRSVLCGFRGFNAHSYKRSHDSGLSQARGGGAMPCGYTQNKVVCKFCSGKTNEAPDPKFVIPCDVLTFGNFVFTHLSLLLFLL